MNKEQIRIEILKLCFGHHRKPDEIIEVARALEAYVTGHSAEVVSERVDPVKQDPRSRKKATGNSDDILS